QASIVSHNSIINMAGVNRLEVFQNIEALNDVYSKSSNPDRRYYHPNNTYSTPEEKQAYDKAYANGYDSGFSSTYDTSYERAYRTAFDQANRRGCEEARRKNYNDVYQNAKREAYDRGYADAYQRNYNQYYRQAYDRAFQYASVKAYEDNYQNDYNRYFESARSEAYRQRYSEIYNSSYGLAHEKKYNEVYPIYARQEYNKGRKDEADDFAKRPVRLLEAEVTETIVNGVFEPGEALRVQLQLRNFANSALTGRDIKLQIKALDARSAVITEGEATLVKNLKAKSLTTVSEALEFRMNENVANQASQFRLSAFYQGRNIGEIVLNVKTKFALQLEMAERPQIKEGLVTTFKVRVRNQSSVPTDPSLKVEFRTDDSIVDNVRSEDKVGTLMAGEEKIVSFPVVGRKDTNTVNMPLLFQASISNGRTIGLFDETQNVPVMNDYRINLTNTDLKSLNQTGITRLNYVIRNVNRRPVPKGLQVITRVNGKDGANFMVVGPNPQYIIPLITGQTTTFVVPMMAKVDGFHGQIELEVQEDGRAVVIHRVNF
ncbi:MAG: hypothetical protein KDD45_07025, partial [Bdellovibrionales bacterium]|nr:hypothetical protein [Bdellovibrionales bacterium]